MLYAIAAALVLIADQLLKYWTTLNLALGEEAPLIDGIIHLTNVHNTGSAFSFLGNWDGARWLFLVLTVVFLVIVIMGFVKNTIRHPLGKITAALVTAGAVGNAIDRALYGFVVDMFEVEFMSFAVFNIADIFITCCGILFCIHVLLCKDSLDFEGDKVDTSDVSFDDELAPRAAKQEKKRAAAPVQAEKAAQSAPAPAPRPRPAPKPIPVFDPANPFAEWENPSAAEDTSAAEPVTAEPAAVEEAPQAEEIPAAPAAEAPAEIPAEAPAAEPEFISIPVPEIAPAAEEEPQEEEEEEKSAAPAETFEISGESFSLDDILAEFSDN